MIPNNQLLHELRERHPKAIYSYLPILNADEEQARFLRGEVRNPHFLLDDKYQESYFQHRLQALQEDLARATKAGQNKAAIQFISERIAQTEILLLLHELRNPQATPPPAVVNTFRDYMVGLYGPPDEDLVLAALGTLKIKAQQSTNPVVPETFNELIALLNYAPQVIKQPLPFPSQERFDTYKDELASILPAFFEFLFNLPHQSVYTTKQICDHFKAGIAVLDIKGWRVVTQKHSNRIMVAKRSKEIEVGAAFKPSSRRALQQVIAHELLGHVRSHSLLNWPETPLQFEEGFAILIEQLVAPRFAYKRLTRYLAAAFSFGVDGRRRDFKETHEIIWRCFVALTGCSIERAKERAFKECTRVFRIGAPNIPGAVFLKDKVYLEGNIALWRLLLAEPPKASLSQIMQGQRVTLAGIVEI